MEDEMSDRESQPDGPVADSSEGYGVSRQQALADHDSDCQCPDCIEERKFDDSYPFQDEGWDDTDHIFESERDYQDRLERAVDDEVDRRRENRNEKEGR
jgi:hypothetical protein